MSDLVTGREESDPEQFAGATVLIRKKKKKLYGKTKVGDGMESRKARPM